MAPSELRDGVALAGTRIVALTHRDIDAGLALSDAAGWNQTADDWAFFVDAGRALGMRDDEGRLVATAACHGDGHQAWISLVLVAAEARHRGMASALVTRCIEQIRRHGETAVLDATPAGAEVYARLGFAPGLAFTRWERVSSDATYPAPAMDREAPSSLHTSLHGAGRADTLERIVALDVAAHRRDRRAMFESFLARPETRVWSSADGQGFVVARAGRRAWHVGPLVAADDAAAAALLRDALDAMSRQPGQAVFVDVPDERVALADALARRGFSVQRSFVRMALGDAAASRLGAHSHALAGPEYG